jgi:phage shock protein A
MRGAEGAFEHVAGEGRQAVVELRRDAVAAVVLHQGLREQLSGVRAKAAFIEGRASRALGRGDEGLARRILAQGICTLKTRDAIEEEANDARSRVSDLLFALVRAENQAWHAETTPQAASGREPECHSRGRDGARSPGRRSAARSDASSATRLSRDFD